MRLRALIPVAACALAATAAVPASAAPVPAGPAGPPDGLVWVVSLGDSYISGEAGRWAGNQSFTTADVDALGRSAYWDAGDRESIERCHRSRSAAIHIGVVKSLNLACSGAITRTMFDDDGDFKPGIDFYDQAGRKGQALMLQEFASQNNVRMVALSIGGNNFHFSDIIEQCVKDFLVPISSPKCREDDEVNSYVSESATEKVRSDTVEAILNVAQAMDNAGYEDSDWTLVLQLYPQSLPGSGDMRYGEFGYARQYDGGCGFRDADLDWATGTLLPLVNRTFRGAGQDAQAERPTLQIAVMDTSRAFHQRQLCHDRVWRVQERNMWGTLKGPKNWQAEGAVDQSEWVMEINIINAFETYQQESLHPNLWGQLALRNCWRQVWNGGDVQGGVCERHEAGGLTADCEPRMTLVSNESRRRSFSPVSETAADEVRVTLRCPAISLAAGERAVLRGRVTGADPDARVRLQMRWDSGAWRDQGSRRPAADGSYRFTWEVPATARAGRIYQWRVVVTAGTAVLATSRVRTTPVR